MGTSHRQEPVKDVVAPRARRACASCSPLPDGYEVALGNGGTTAFWDAPAFGLVRERALHLTFGEFSLEVREGHRRRAVPRRPDRRHGRARRRARADLAADGVDVVAWAHNETSTGVMVRRRAAGRRRARAHRRDLRRRRPARRRRAGRRLLLRAAEVLRRRRRPVARAAEPRRAGAHRRDRGERTAGSPSSCRSPRRWTTRARTRPTTRPRSRRCCCSPTRSSG